MQFSYRTRKIISSLLSYSFLYLALILCLGYAYGSGDLIEIQPYWDAFFHPEIWEKDFFVSHQMDRVPNERFVFVWLLSLTGPPNPYVPFTAHILTSFLLFHGMKKLAALWIKNESWQFLAIACMTIGLYGINTGGNELYYPIFTNSYLAQAIGIWSIYFMVTNKQWSLVVTLIITAFIHILIGIQLVVLIVGAMFLKALIKGDLLSFTKKITLPIITWIMTAGIFFLFLFVQVQQGTIEASEQFEIMEFRLPHHFFPSYFPVKSWLIIGLLTVFGLFFFMKRNALITLFMLLTISGAIIYSIGVYFLGSTLVLSSQWFESTIWMEFISVIALISALSKGTQQHFNPRLGFVSTAAIVSTLLICVSLSPLPIFKSRSFGEPLGKGIGWDEDISKKVRDLGLSESMFAIPPELTAFKWYAQEPTYVDYKAMIHHKQVMVKWYQRVRFLYGIDITDRREGHDLYEKANKHLGEMLEASPRSLQNAGITHVILPSGLRINTQPIIENKKYKVYPVE